nr:MAG TPA: hypothetical protein [Bacteriophage sp.]
MRLESHHCVLFMWCIMFAFSEQVKKRIVKICKFLI